MSKEFKVTPWEVTGDIDYDKVVKDFGVQIIDKKLLERIKKHTGELHPTLRRNLFFAHRDLNWILDEYEKGNKFFLYTGRGPSGNTHLGHLFPWFLTKWLQDKFDVKLFFQMTDDEKFLTNSKLDIETTKHFAYENALDVIALGFNPKKTKIYSDYDNAKTFYYHATRVAKKITFSTAKATFGFGNDTNVGQIFYTSMQAVPAFLESVEQGKNIPCLIPHAIDQDPHFRVARDVMPKLGYYKPASVQGMFMPGLVEGGKMSASKPDSAIFTTDDLKTAKKKVMSAFTGGQASIEEQRKKGGNSEICSVFSYFKFIFEENDAKLEKRQKACKEGKILCGECKKDLSERVVKFLEKHQEKREKAKDVLDKFLVKD
ncbi:MAG: tryptophan--tRNA ligase [DPANN group archaeon]|nr:tryptophan--tRNA ligase [DPANN group archaeon]